jgi:hypothetical protein
MPGGQTPALVVPIEDSTGSVTAQASSHACFSQYPAEIRALIFKQAILADMGGSDTLYTALIYDYELPTKIPPLTPIFIRTNLKHFDRSYMSDFMRLLNGSQIRLVNSEALEVARAIYRAATAAPPNYIIHADRKRTPRHFRKPLDPPLPPGFSELPFPNQGDTAYVWYGRDQFTTRKTLLDLIRAACGPDVQHISFLYTDTANYTVSANGGHFPPLYVCRHAVEHFSSAHHRASLPPNLTLDPQLATKTIIEAMDAQARPETVRAMEYGASAPGTFALVVRYEVLGQGTLRYNPALYTRASFDAKSMSFLQEMDGLKVVNASVLPRLQSISLMVPFLPNS